MGSRNLSGLPSSFWKGLEFVRFILRHYFLDQTSDAYLRGRKVTQSFSRTTRNFSDNTKQLLRYYKKYVPSDLEDVQLYGIFETSNHDGDYGLYTNLAERYCGPDKQIEQRKSPFARDHQWEDESNSRVFWEQRGYLMHAGGVCSSLNSKLLDGGINFRDMDYTKCSFPVQSFKDYASRNCTG